MKTVTCKSGLKGWQGKLQKFYASFEEFEAYCMIYSNHKRLGYTTPRLAWDDNPTVRGSVNPSDLEVVKPTKAFKKLMIGNRFRFAKKISIGNGIYNLVGVKKGALEYRMGGLNRIIGNVNTKVIETTDELN